MDYYIEPTAFKFVLLGSGPVGKSEICYSFADIETSNLISVIGNDKFEKKIKLKNNKDIKIVLFDTTGQERFLSTSLKCLKSTQGVILVFDVTSRHSFENLGNLLDNVRDNLSDPFIILFRNKADLPREKWEVTSEEINDFSKKNGLACF